MREFAELVKRLLALEARVAGQFRRGTVAEVDPAAGTVRLTLGDGADGPYLSPAIPYAQIAGALKVHTPPSVGQQMMIAAESGDFRQGVALPFTWSDANASPGQTSEENVLTFGAFRIGLKGDELVISGPRVRLECGGVSFDLSSAGLALTGGDVRHDDTDEPAN